MRYIVSKNFEEIEKGNKKIYIKINEKKFYN